MPGRLAIGTCAHPSYMLRPAISSAMAITSHFRQSAAIVPSSSRVKTLPVGLLGVLMMMALVLLLKAAASSSGSNVQLVLSPVEGEGSRSVTYRGVAPERIA